MFIILAAALITLLLLLHLYMLLVVHLRKRLLLLVSSIIIALYGATSRLNLVDVQMKIFRLLDMLLFRFTYRISRAIRRWIEAAGDNITIGHTPQS